MRLSLAVALVASAQLATAASLVRSSTELSKGLRLVKTSEADPGSWVHPDDYFDRFTSKGLGFIDITEIQVCRPTCPPFLATLLTNPQDNEVMAILNGDVPFEAASAQSFPDKMMHVEEAKKLIGASSIDASKGWIKELSEYVFVFPPPPNYARR